MDVSDRKVRLDALPISPPTDVASVAASPASPSFATTLQRSQSRPTAPGDTTGKSPARPVSSPAKSGSDKNVAADKQPGSRIQPDDSSHTTETDDNASAAANVTSSATAPPANSVTERADSQPPRDASETAENLIGGLIVATTQSAPKPPTPAPVTSPPAPTALVQALQTPISNPIPPPTSEDSPAPSIPVALQAGIATKPDPTSAPTTTDTAPKPAAIQVNSPARQPPAHENLPKLVGEITVAEKIPSPPLTQQNDSPATPVSADSAPDPQAAIHPVAASLAATIPGGKASANKAKSAPEDSPATSNNPGQNPPSTQPSAIPAAAVLPPVNFAAAASHPARTDLVRTVRASAAGQIASGPSPDDRISAADQLPQMSLAQPANRSGDAAFANLLNPSITATGETNNAPPNVAQQIHPGLHQALFQDRQMTITLRPPELGSVQIDIIRHDGQLTARLQTETATAHQLLTDQLPQLREALTQWGVSADQVQVVRAETPSTGAGDFTQTGNGPADSGGESSSRQEPQSQSPPQLPLPEEPARDEVQPQFIRTKTALNLQI